MTKIWAFFYTLLTLLIGQFTWHAPSWLHSSTGYFKTNTKAAMALIITCFGAVLGGLYYDSLPKPLMVVAKIANIEPTLNDGKAKPNNLMVQFEYDFSALNSDQPRPQRSPSIARIDLVHEEVKNGINLSPVKKGKWTWVDDHKLQFIPVTDWPADTEYSIVFNKSIFTDDAILSARSYSFNTAKFDAKFSAVEFYQDPNNVSIRRVVATLKFSHPVNKETLEKNISMEIQSAEKHLNVKKNNYKFTVTYDKNYREAYIQSGPITLPKNTSYMKISLAKGVGSLLGGKLTKAEETQVKIPNIYSFLTATVKADVISNEKGEPEQIIMMSFTDEIDQLELLGKLSLYLLPKNNPVNGRTYWQSPREVSENVLNKSKKIKFSLIKNERVHSKVYNLKIDVPENRYLYIKINNGLTSINKFIHRSFYDDVLAIPRYPKEVGIVGQGAVLSYSGNHQLTILSRGVSGLQYSIGRLLNKQIYHFVSQTRGDIGQQKFKNWTFNKENIADFKTSTVKLIKDHPKKAQYSSFDLSNYLTKEANRFGLFFINVNAFNHDKKRVEYGASDERLVLITDLGVIVKNNADSSHDIFVQSISSGNPVAGAMVELLGKNGVPVFSGKTDLQGHMVIPFTKSLSREKEPTVYIIKKEHDLSFMPFNRSARKINYSEFDVGGINRPNYTQGKLSAFMFTDRGIYRPGDVVNTGVIIKNSDFSRIKNIPLELVIRNSRNKEVRVNKFNLPEMGLIDFQYVTEATSITGRYHASIHHVRDNKYRGREIGRTEFKVEEFQPDTLKIQSNLLGMNNKGWNTDKKIKAKVYLKNLFGLPAKDRKLRAKVSIKPHDFYFEDYKDYLFKPSNTDDKTKPLSLNTVIGTKLSDADGEAEFDIDISRFNQGSYHLRFLIEGFDQAGGRSVVTSSTTLLSPLETLVGYKADGKLDYINAKSKRSLEFIAIDKSLKKVNLNELTLNIIELEKVSTLIKQKNNTYKYQTLESRSLPVSAPFKIDVNSQRYDIETTNPGDYLVEIIDKQGRKLSEVRYSVVGSANLAGKIDKSAELQLKLDKADYFPGGLINMSIKAPYIGSGLITIESDRVHHYKWFKTSEESTVQSIKIPKNLEGTAYVNVTFVRDASSNEIFTSPLSYAVQPFAIDKSKRKIDITLTTKEIVRPGKAMAIKFSTSKPSRIAVFAVDEGILQVSKYKTPKPLQHFMRKRALSVQTLQILDLILPDFNIVKKLSAPGGGMADQRKALAKNLNPFMRSTDNPAVYWSGVYDAGQIPQELTFMVPDTFAGELRVMAVAVNEESVGSTSTSVIARGPFVISPNVLIQAAPNDEFLATIGVANIIKGSGVGAEVELSVTASEQLEIIGERKTRLIIDEGSEASFTFKVKATQKLGDANLIFTARHKEEVAKRTTSLSVRPAMPYYSTFNGGFDKNGSIKLLFQRSLYPDFSKQIVTASASPLVIIDGLTSYLEHFPHGCTEQVVSKVFPLVGLMNQPQYAPHLADVKKHFNQLIDKLRQRQLGDGGFAFWPGDNRSKNYPTIYAMHFLLEAQAAGYPVPNDILQRGKNYLESYAAKPSILLADARDRANAIYLLTRMGEVTSNYLVDLEESLRKNNSDSWQQDITSVYMASTYKLLQKSQEASYLIEGYQLNSNNHKAINDFRSELAMDAQYIYLLVRHFESIAKNLNGEDIVKLTEKIFKGEYNTISSAYSILALGAYSQLISVDKPNSAINIYALYDEQAPKKLPTKSTPFLAASYDASVSGVNIESPESFFYLNKQAGFDRSLPDTIVRNGLEITRQFFDENGNSVTSFEQGKKLTVKLKIRALGDKILDNIVAVDLLPGGFEVIRSSVLRNNSNWQADYIDIREDRIVFYGSFDKKVRELSYEVKLTAAGEFVVPPSYAESMYDRSIHANSMAGHFSVQTSQ